MRPGLRRSPLRLLAAAAVTVLAATTVAVVLPVAAPEATPGHLVRDVLPLSGTGAPARAPAVDDPARSVAKAAPRTVDTAWSADVDVPDGTQMVDLTWAGSPDGAAQIRFRDPATRAWSDWTDVVSEPDESPDAGGNGRNGIDPLWVGHDGTTDVQVKVARGDLTDLQLGASHWVPPTGGGATAGAEPAGPMVHGRSEWAPGGWRSDTPGCGPAPTVMAQLRFAVVHHTVNSNSYGPEDVPGMMAAIYRYHTDGRGWCDIAYNFVIDRFGRVWQGRSGDINSPIMGGHAKGFNTDSVGVALLGQYDPGSSPTVARPTTGEMNALKSLLAWKLGIHGLAPYATVTVTTAGSTKYPPGTRVTIPVINGHQDTSLTGCPGDYVYDLLPSVRQDVTALIRGAETPALWQPFTNGQSFFRQLLLDAVGKGTNTQAAQMTSAVVRNGQSRVGMARNVVVSTDTYNRIGYLVALYQATLARLPSDSPTFRLWVSRRDAGWSQEQLANAFISSSGFRARYGQSITNEQFVRIAYQNVLHQPNPTSERIAYWSSQLRAGRSRGYVMNQFIKNSAFQARMSWEVKLTEIYFALLRRLPDPAGRSMWFTLWGHGATTVDTVAAVLGSQEYLDRF